MRIWRRICLRITRKLLETGSGIAWEVFREENWWRDDSECGGDREESGGELAGERRRQRVGRVGRVSGGELMGEES